MQESVRLKKLARFEPDIIKGTEQDSDPVRRYRNMEAYPRLFARFKLRFDPMFSELDRLLPARGGISTIIDIGCGTGANIASFAEDFHSVGIDTSNEAVRWARERFPKVRFLVGRAPEDLGDLMGQARLFLLNDVLEHVREVIVVGSEPDGYVADLDDEPKLRLLLGDGSTEEFVLEIDPEDFLVLSIPRLTVLVEEGGHVRWAEPGDL